MSDAIKRPSHYAEGRKYEPKDVIRDWQLNFNLGSAVKYISRAGRKDDIVQDLKKAQEFIQFEIDAIEKERAKVNPIPPKHPMCKIPLGHKQNGGMRELIINVPAGADKEEIIWRVIDVLYGGELK